MQFLRFISFLLGLMLLIGWSNILKGNWGKGNHSNQYVDIDPSSCSVLFKDGRVHIIENRLSNSLHKSVHNSTNAFTIDLFPLKIMSDFIMSYLWFYDELGNGNDTLIFLEDSVASVLRPAGRYSLFAGYWPDQYQHTLIVKDHIHLSAPSQVQITEEEADQALNFNLRKETGNPLGISVISFYFYSKMNDSKFRITSFNDGYNTFRLKYNFMPQSFEKEWAVKGKQLHNGGNLYLLSGEITDDLPPTTNITNNPANLVHADFYYHFPDSLTNGSYFQISTLFPDFHWAGAGDPIYTHPIQLRVYQDTTLSIAFRASTFIQFVSSNALFYITTHEVRIDNQMVTGYFLSDRNASSFIISNKLEKTNLGLTPTYWFGKFMNQADTIKIRSPHGKFQHLFLSQSNDILLHYNVDFQIFSNGVIIKEGKFPYAAGSPIMFLGFNPDSLTIPVSPGTYEMVITDNDYELNAQPGISRVKARFNLNQLDRNPPNITLFQILAEDELTYALNPFNNNRVRFTLEEEGVVNGIQLFYGAWNDSIWHEIPLNHNAPFWDGSIPYLSEGLYSLRLLACDGFQNYIDCIMSPAFVMEESTAIKNNSLGINSLQQIQLYPNYPNPFNEQTLISYVIPNNFSSEIQIAIYNLLGQKVAILYEGRTTSGHHQLYWNGTDSDDKQTASGIYYLVLKGGDLIIKQKLIVIH